MQVRQQNDALSHNYQLAILVQVIERYRGGRERVEAGKERLVLPCLGSMGKHCSHIKEGFSGARPTADSNSQPPREGWLGCRAPLRIHSQHLGVSLMDSNRVEAQSGPKSKPCSGLPLLHVSNRRRLVQEISPGEAASACRRIRASVVWKVRAPCVCTQQTKRTVVLFAVIKSCRGGGRKFVFLFCGACDQFLFDVERGKGEEVCEKPGRFLPFPFEQSARPPFPISCSILDQLVGRGWPTCLKPMGSYLSLLVPSFFVATAHAFSTLPDHARLTRSRNPKTLQPRSHPVPSRS